jgi:hydrogenase nickel incorporation protein HypB
MHMPKGYVPGNSGSRPGAEENATIASLNRNAFRRAGVLSVNVVGGAGCGKTTLIVQTIARLIPEWKAGVIAANSTFNPDIGRFDAVAAQIAKLQPSSGTTLMPHDVQAGLSQLDLSPLEVVFIENLGLLPDRDECDLGEKTRVVVFSVAAGADQAAKHPQVVQWADAVLLNKLDLLPLSPFDLDSFRSDVKRLNSRARFIEVSCKSGTGLDEFAQWVRAQIKLK